MQTEANFSGTALPGIPIYQDPGPIENVTNSYDRETWLAALAACYLYILSDEWGMEGEITN